MWKVLNRVLKLSELALGFTFKRKQELSMGYPFNCIDVMAVLPSEFRKGLIFHMFVMMCGVRNKKRRRTGFSKHHTRSSKWLR